MASSRGDIYGDGIGCVELVDYMGSDRRVVDAARVSFARHEQSEAVNLSDGDKKLIKYLMANGHTSPFEHCTITWRFVVPLFVARQHMRHRTWAYNEISRRYTSDNIRFYIPSAFRKQHEKDRQASKQEFIDDELATTVFSSNCDKDLDFYNKLIKIGVCREQARMTLPQNMYTEYYGTVNLHNALNFVRIRNDEHAQWEIQQVAKEMLWDLDSLFPVSVEAWNETR